MFLSLAPKIAKVVQQAIEDSTNATDKKVLDTTSMRSLLKFLLAIVRKHTKLATKEVSQSEHVVSALLLTLFNL